MGGEERGIKKHQQRYSMPHKLITKILFLSKEKAVSEWPIKERMKGKPFVANSQRVVFWSAPLHQIFTF